MSANSFSLGITPASEFFVAFTSTMTFIASSFRLGAPPRSEMATNQPDADRHGHKKIDTAAGP
ncbi:hypothetical protein HV824_33155 [Myxococcus sp. AM009]|uniref:hypothetical protein n=1 Tax=Myxococcus sp. AM009 TaxID=2745137 RepID=UPI001595A7B0|nr:hypothetical protein [Myxococcus sp. AM009]NVJ02935.1 hypothetical protein [Myxococcus sp. AM009]